jgi:NAD(P)-dependent dehydrogenase (short-subunit alcohol dehydrogenase family)
MSEERKEARSGLSGRVVLVVGATTPYGRAVCRALAEEGAALECWAEAPSQEPLTELAEELRSLGVPARARIVRGSAGYEELASAASDLGRAMGSVYGLCFAEGTGHYAPTGHEDLTAWQRAFEHNVHLAFAVTKAVLPYLLVTSGSAVYIAASAGLAPQPYLAAYSASKAALVAMTRSLALEFKGRGVRFNAVSPAGVEGRSVGEGGLARELAFLSSSFRLAEPSPPEAVAEAVVFLLSPRSTRLTGQVIELT